MATVSVKASTLSINELHRAQNILKRTLIVLVIAFWRDGNQIEEIAVAQLDRGHIYYFCAAGGFVGVTQRNRESAAAVDVGALVTAPRSQIVIALLQSTDKIVCSLLQAMAVTSG